MDRDYIWQCDYGNRDYLRPVLKKLLNCQNASSLQCLMLAVNNNPYNLEFFLLVSYDKPQDNDVNQMITLFEGAGLLRRTDVSSLQLMKEAKNRRFQMVTLLDEESVDLIFQNSQIFVFRERNQLEELGYHMVPFGKQARVFLSHSSLDKPDVEELLPYLNAANLPVWFDKYDIEIGESIVDGVQAGVKDSDNVIFWITKNFLRSKWCKHEMNAFIRKLIDGRARIISILDHDICIDDLPIFLQDIKYIERKGHTTDSLALQITRLFGIEKTK